MSDILGAILPLFLIIGLGVLLRALRIANEQWVTILNRYGLYVGLPALVLNSLLKAGGAQVLNWNLIGLNTLLLLGILLLTLGVTRVLRLRLSLANTFVVGVFFGNIGYLGYPFISGLIPGSEALISIHIALYNILLFSAGLLVLELSRGDNACCGDIPRRLAANPLVLAIVLGLLFLISGLRPPPFINKGIGMLAASAPPVVLFSLGVFLFRPLPRGRVLGSALLLCGLRLLAVPLLFLACSHWLQPGPAFRVSILEAGMPMAIVHFALAEEYALEKDVIAAAITVSTVLSLFSLSLVWALIR